MRLCVVSGTFHPEPGGPPTFLYHLLPELQQRGYEIEVLTYGEADAPTHYPYRVTRISRRQPIPLRLLAFTRTLLQKGRWAEAFFISDYGLPVALANLVLRKPSLLKNVGDFAWEFSTRRKWIPTGQTIDEFQTASHSARVNLLRQVQRWYSQSADTIVAPSHYSASLVLGWGIASQKVRVIYNALDPITDNNSQSSARQILNLDPTYRYIITVARLTPWKGISHIIRTLPEIQRNVSNVRLIIVGDGPEREALERGVASLGEAVAFVGNQSPERVRLYLQAANVFALFSTYEGLPHTVLEATQVGTPVVVSDAGGNVEVVTDGETGWVVPKSDERALVVALCEALQNPHEANRRAQAAQSQLDRFSWPRLVAEYDAALRELV